MLILPALRSEEDKKRIKPIAIRLALGEWKCVAAEQTLARSNQSLTNAHRALGGSLKADLESVENSAKSRIKQVF